MNVAINGMGRIGRLVLRAAMGGVVRDKRDPNSQRTLAVSHINEVAGNAETTAHLLEFDSLHGRWHSDIRADETSITVNDTEIAFSNEADPAGLDWGDAGIDMVLDCTGKFRSAARLKAYFDNGVKKVIVAAPVHESAALNIVMGVNHDSYEPDIHHLLTAASCTTNCLAPVVKVIHEHLTIRHGQITTIHNPTNTNVVIDAAHKDLRRARSSLLSLQPTTTGSARAISLIYPELTGRLNGHAVRVPVLNASLTDCVFETQTPTDEVVVNALFEAAAASPPLAGILGTEQRPLVSADYLNDTRSSIVDLPSTMVTDGTLVKIYAWYDNEMGYACRMVDLANYVSDMQD